MCVRYIPRNANFVENCGQAVHVLAFQASEIGLVFAKQAGTLKDTKSGATRVHARARTQHKLAKQSEPYDTVNGLKAVLVSRLELVY